MIRVRLCCEVSPALFSAALDYDGGSEERVGNFDLQEVRGGVVVSAL